MAAGQVARKARALGLRVPSWVKTSLASGSPAAVSFSRDWVAKSPRLLGVRAVLALAPGDRIEIDASADRLAHRGSCATEGRTPRVVALHPDGRVLYALNEDSDSIVAIEVNADKGTPGRTLGSLHTGSPVCMVFGR